MPRKKKPRYDPERDPEAAFWTKLTEDEQLHAIIRYHRLRSIKTGDPQLHGLTHQMVEQQLASAEMPEARRKLQELVNDGLTRHEAVHAIGMVLSEYIVDTTREIDSEDPPATPYEERLDALTAESWYSLWDDEEDSDAFD